MWWRAALLFLIAAAGGCTSASFQVVDAQTGAAIPECRVTRLVEHGTLQQFLMGLPAGHAEAESQVSDVDGVVKFPGVARSDSFLFYVAGELRGRVDRGDVLYRMPDGRETALCAGAKGNIVPLFGSKRRDVDRAAGG